MTSTDKRSGRPGGRHLPARLLWRLHGFLPNRRRGPVAGTSHLSDHILCDIGLRQRRFPFNPYGLPRL